MAQILRRPSLDMDQKARLMQQDARHEIVDVRSDCAEIFASVKAGVRARPAPPQAPKMFLANDCAFNCAYCGCRCGNERKQRYMVSPRELAELSYKKAKDFGQGIFITSAIYRNADYTEELIIETMRILRQEMRYSGYLHAKIMPGADPALIHRAGLLADRLSVNIEVAKSEGYARIARNKNRQNILGPMGQISRMIREAKAIGRGGPRFATSQSTQIMAGSVGEDDRTILTLTHALYRKYSLQRVYYTSFCYKQEARGYDDVPKTITPHWRMRRLYQADRLMQLYGLTPDEIAPEEEATLSEGLDPKAAYAIRNLHLFPVEVNTAELEMLLRVPGIGTTGAKRIVAARQSAWLSHESLSALGISLKRSRHFITCKGKFTGVRNQSLLRMLLCDSGVGEQTILPLEEPRWTAGDVC